MRRICPAGHVTTWPPIKSPCGAQYESYYDSRTMRCPRYAVAMPPAVEAVYLLEGVSAALETLDQLTDGKAFL